MRCAALPLWFRLCCNSLVDCNSLAGLLAHLTCVQTQLYKIGKHSRLVLILQLVEWRSEHLNMHLQSECICLAGLLAALTCIQAELYETERQALFLKEDPFWVVA